MAECLACGTQIAHLKWEQIVTISGKLYPNGKITTRSTDPCEEASFYCPKCDELLLVGTDDVIGFLKGRYDKHSDSTNKSKEGIECKSQKVQVRIKK
jgi:hypothetical protein